MNTYRKKKDVSCDFHVYFTFLLFKLDFTHPDRNSKLGSLLFFFWLCWVFLVILGLSYPRVCEILVPEQGWNPCVLHWEADSQPLDHQGSPKFYSVWGIQGEIRQLEKPQDRFGRGETLTIWLWAKVLPHFCVSGGESDPRGPKARQHKVGRQGGE